MGAGQSDTREEGTTENEGLFSLLSKAFENEANQVHSTTDQDAEDPNAQFNASVREFHLARAEERVYDALVWLAAVNECHKEAKMSDGNDAQAQSFAVTRNEILHDCEGHARAAASSKIAALSKARKKMDPEEKQASKSEAKRIKAICFKLGLSLSRNGKKEAASVRSSNGEVGTSSGPNVSSNGALLALKRREAALSALEEACSFALSELCEEDRGASFGSVRESFDKCLLLGIPAAQATALYARCMKKGCLVCMDAAVAPLERRQETRRDLGKMQRRAAAAAAAKSSSSSGSHQVCGEGELSVELDDSEDPSPHLSALTRLLSRASVVLVEIMHSKQSLDQKIQPAEVTRPASSSAAAASPLSLSSTVDRATLQEGAGTNDLSELQEWLLQDASARAKRALSHFREEKQIDKLQALSLSFMDMRGRQDGGAADSEGEGGKEEDAGDGTSRRRRRRRKRQREPIDVSELDSCLNNLTDLIELCHRFFAFLQAPPRLNGGGGGGGGGGVGLAARAVSELPLFSTTLQLAAMYVDLETCYCTFNVHKAIETTALMEVSHQVFVSSLAEDIFFVLRDKTLDRAFATLSEQVILAMTQRVVEVLDTNSPTEPSLFHAVSALPETASGDKAAARAAAAAYRQHRRQARNEVKVGEASGGEESAASVETTEEGSPVGGEALDVRHLVQSLTEEMEEGMTWPVDGLMGEEGLGSLLGLITACNTADFAAVSLHGLCAYLEEEVAALDAFATPADGAHDTAGSTMARAGSLAAKVAATTGTDLGEFATTYAHLRANFEARLVDSFFAEPLHRVRQGIAARSFHMDSSGGSSSAGPALPGGDGGAMTTAADRPRRKRDVAANLFSGLVAHAAGAAGNKPTAATQAPHDSLAAVCRECLFEGCAWFTVSSRLTPSALASVLQVLATTMADAVCDLFTAATGTGRRTVNEWGALVLQREVRELQRYLTGFLDKEASSLSTAFSKLDQVVLLLNFDRPSDFSLYQLDRELLSGDDMRAVLGARFGLASAQIRFPWETK